jgi:hypothetical protein
MKDLSVLNVINSATYLSMGQETSLPQSGER